jgi:cytochrome P450
VSIVEIDVDFAQAESWNEDMHERMRWLRKNEPVFWSEKTRAFIISRYADVGYVSKNNEIFCSGEGVLPGAIGAKIGLIDEDEPRHAEMIGIRPQDRKRFHRWSDALIGAQGNLDKPEFIQRASKAALEYYTYLTDIIADRRQSPRDDLISILVRARDEGILVQHESRVDPDHPLSHGDDDQREMSNDELIKLCVLLLVAGNETDPQRAIGLDSAPDREPGRSPAPHRRSLPHQVGGRGNAATRVPGSEL